MASRDQSIEFFENLASRGKKAKCTEREFRRALGRLAERQGGLDEDELLTLVRAMVAVPMTLARFSSLIRVAVPRTSVPAAAVEEMALFAWGNHGDRQTCAILALQWISAVLEHELVAKAAANKFFELFFALLFTPAVERDASRLVYELVGPGDVSRWRVNVLLLLHEKNNRKRHTNAVLQRFKSFRPELLPENVAARDERSSFKRTSALLGAGLEAAAHRLREQGGGAGPAGRLDIQWGQTARRGKRPGLGSRLVDLIPAVTTVQLGSALRRQKLETCSLLSFKTLRRLSCFLGSVQLPAQAASLLDNDAGLHVLAFGGDALHCRLRDTLQTHLPLVLRDGCQDAEHAARLLQRLAALQALTQQALPVVTAAVVDFLPRWNGRDFRAELLALLEHNEMPVENLDAVVFPHLHRLFMQAEQHEQCLVLASLTRFMENMFLSSWRRGRGLRSPMVAMETSGAGGRDEDLSLALSAAFVGQLCAAALADARTDLSLLHRCLDFYETMSCWERGGRLAVWTLPPPAVFYRALLSRNLHCVSRALTLLLRYVTEAGPRIRALGLAEDFRPQFTLVAQFAADARNALWDATALTNEKAGLLFRGAQGAGLAALATPSEADSAFAPPTNQAFAPFLQSAAGKPQDWRSQVDSFLPQLRQLVVATNAAAVAT